MNMTLIKVEILHNTLYKRMRERSAKRNFYSAFSHLFFFVLVILCGCFKAGTDALICMKGRRRNYLRHFVADNGYGTPTRTRPVSISHHSLCA